VQITRRCAVNCVIRTEQERVGARAEEQTEERKDRNPFPRLERGVLVRHGAASRRPEAYEEQPEHGGQARPPHAQEQREERESDRAAEGEPEGLASR
jgi:hypothetical protein